jgi:UDP-glucuronate 4-epimerase
MALFKFTKAILEGREIDVYNNGNLSRDFTYIDDIVEGIIRIADVIPQQQTDWTPEQGSPANSSAPYRIYNIGNGSPVKLLDFINAIETSLGIEAKKNMLPMQPGDVPVTYADTTPLEQDFGYKPSTPLRDGLRAFAEWYKKYYF